MESHAMRKVLFFDFGDVLVFYDHMRSCRALAEYSDKSADEIYQIVFGSKLEELHYNRGDYTDAQWYQLCCERLELRDCPYPVFAEKWGDIFSPNPKIGTVLDALRPDVDAFVVSNTNGLHWAWARDNLPVLAQYFSDPAKAILSSEEKSRKPEELIFRRALERAAVAPEHAVFVDDKPVNVEAFERLGVQGVVYSARETPIEDLEQALKGLGYL